MYSRAMIGCAVLGFFIQAQIPTLSKSTRAEEAVKASNEIPKPPEGYTSKAAIMAAIATGVLPLIKKEDKPPAGIKELLDIEYGSVGNRKLTLDLDLPQGVSKRVPGLIFIHGGGWEGGERTIYHYYTRRFAQRGYAAATVSYRLSREAPYPAAVHDVKCAVRWMRANADTYGIDPDRIVAIGGSAGGHLAMMLGYSDDPALEGNGGHSGVSSRVAAVANFYGPVDLTSEEGQTAGVVKKFLAASYEEAPDRFREASPITHLDAKDPPTLIVHGTLDDVVTIQQADLLAKRLDELNIPCTYARLEGWPHTLDAALPMNEYCQKLVLKFLTDHVGPPDTSDHKPTSNN